jgi:hypothetical protein
MRSKYRTVWLVLVAALAVTALSASSAFASLPEFTHVKPGETFSGKVGSPNWELSNGWTWNDTEATISGEFVTEGTLADKALKNVKLKFTGENRIAGCENGATGAGELVLTGLEAYLGYINESTKQIGLAFFKPGGEWFAMKLEPTLTKCTNELEGNGKFVGVLVVPMTHTGIPTNKNGLSFKKGESKGTMLYNASTFRMEKKDPFFPGLKWAPELVYGGTESYKEKEGRGVGIATEIPFETSNSIGVEG